MDTAIGCPQANLSSFTCSPPAPRPSPCNFHFKPTTSAISFGWENDRFFSRPGAARFSTANPVSASPAFDVIVVGAGIIGLSIARQFLLESDLSVAVVDAAAPSSGATGAGQGYIWMVHKAPESDRWELAMRSQKLWELLAESIQHQGEKPLEVLGWKKTGSMLVGRSLKESGMLKKQVKQLSEAGLKAEFLTSSDLLLEEPALSVGEEGGAAFLPSDCQLDAKQTVDFILKSNRKFVSKDRYAEFYHNPVTSLLRSSASGEVEGVQTSKNILYSKKAIVVAAGSWTGSLMSDLIRGSSIALDVPVKPRKGQLLVVKDFESLKVNHGLMEAGYVDHESHPSNLASGNHDQLLSISMTATMDSMGNLLLGSSRQFVGFNTEADESIIHLIWERAKDFFPNLRGIPLTDLIKSRKVRVGLRPYMPDGKPVIGLVPGSSNVYLAAGHEGEGLLMEKCKNKNKNEVPVDLIPSCHMLKNEVPSHGARSARR